MTTETPTSGIARATEPSELGASESEHRDTVNLDALDLEAVKRVVEAGVAAADDVSGRIHAGGYRGNLSDTEDLRNHVRRLAKATFALLSRLEAAEAAFQSAQTELTDILTMTGCRDREDLEDMARVGKALLERVAEVVAHGPLKGWSPADCPTEIVTDLANHLDDAQAELARTREAT